MTAPNEPGYSRPGDAPGEGAGPADVTGPRSGIRTGEVPPQQRPAPRPRPVPPVPAETQSSGHSPGVNERLQRFIVGTEPGPAKPAPAEPESARTDGHHGSAYASELPDLSRSAPRAAHRGSTAQRVQVAARPRGPVRASMQIRRIDPWSTLKVSLLLSVALFFVWMLAVAFLYLVLGAMGVWSKLNSNVGDLLTNTNGAAELVSSGSIFGGAVLIGLVNIVLLTAMATLGAVVYNVSTDLLGGIEVTLADRD